MAADSACPVVLVIEDEVSIQKTMTKILENDHLEVLSAYNGMEALGHFNKTVPDLILMDVVMPEMDGEQTLRLIRKRFPADIVPVIMVTANSDPNVIKKFLLLGCQNYIVKPVNGNTLLEKVDIYLSRPLPSGRARLHSKSLELATKVLDVHGENLAELINYQAALILILRSAMRDEGAIPFSPEKLSQIANIFAQEINHETFLENAVATLHKTANLDHKKITLEIVNRIIAECDRCLRDKDFSAKL